MTKDEVFEKLLESWQQDAYELEEEWCSYDYERVRREVECWQRRYHEASVIEVD